MKQILFLLLISFSLSAQIKGVVKDSISGKPIAYAAVLYENSKIGVNTDENGNFELPKNDVIQNIQISNLGYNSKTILKRNDLIISLSPKTYELKEVVVEAKQNTKQIELGKLKTGNVSFSNSGTANLWGSFFPYTLRNITFKFIKEVKFITKSRKTNSKIKFRLFTLNSTTNEVTNLLDEEIIITCEKGKQIHTVNLTSYNLVFPTEGLMVAFENLVIEENKFEYTESVKGQKEKMNVVKYEPSIVGYNDEEPNVYSIYKNKASLLNFKEKPSTKQPNLSLQLTLTN